MEKTPLFIALVFTFTTIATVYLLYRAANKSRMLLLVSGLWLAAQALIGLSLFYANTHTVPPRLALAIVPPLLFVVLLIATQRGRQLLNRFDLRRLTLLHIIRVPVEAVLYLLFLHRQVPQLMTFEGRNFDLLSGLTAPLIFYVCFVRTTGNRRLLIVWNFLCVLLLANVMMLGVLSVPSPLQQFSFDQPNVAVLYFPYIWLPAFVVPVVLLAHVASLWQLLAAREKRSRINPFVTTAV